MTDQTITTADLEKDGIVHGYAAACAQTMRETAASATAERFICLAAHELSKAGFPVTSGSVCAYLHEMTNSLTKTGDGLRRSESKTMRETSETLPETGFSGA